MIAKNLISQTVPPLRTSDTGDRALHWMHDFQLRHLPIVNNAQLLGLISEEDILDFNDANAAIGSHKLSLVKPFVRESAHLYEVLKVMVEGQLSIIPVVDFDDNYLGLITIESLLKSFAEAHAITEKGAIIILETHKRDYTLSEIARIVESEGAVILSSFVNSYAYSMQVEITLKLNVEEASRIIASFKRFEYTIKASFQEQDYLHSLQDNYDALINYLNI